MTRIYLDHNATSPARPDVIKTVTTAMSSVGNASAPHGHGRAAHGLIADARESLGLAMGVCAQDIIFTASGTEADNTAIHAAVFAGCKRLLVSEMDHPATTLAAERSGANVERIPCDAQGQTDMDWLNARLERWDLAEGRPFVSICAANSETGVIQNIERATDLTHAAGGLILVDAVQALGKLPMSYQPDYMAVSAHKIGGPMGVGALYVASDAPFDPLLSGGGQERRRRAGTLNVAGIAGFGHAATLSTDLEFTRALRDSLEQRLRAMEPELYIFGSDAERLPNTSFFAVPDTPSATLLMALDLSGISVSTGMACSSGKAEVSRAIQAMGVADKAPKGALRVSLGYTTTPHDIETFLHVWAKIRKKSPRSSFGINAKSLSYAETIEKSLGTVI